MKILLALCFFLLAFAQERPCQSGYNAEGGKKGCLGLFFDGAFLYYQPKEKGLELGYLKDAPPVSQVGKIVEMHYKFQPAFRIGTGYRFSHDGFLLSANYLRFYSEQKTTAFRGDYANFVSSWYFATPMSRYFCAKKISSHWNLKLDLLDFMLSRLGRMGKNLLFIPSCGIKGGRLFQRYISSVETSTGTDLYAKSTNKSASFLIGPSFTVKADWLLGKNLYIYGQGEGTLFYENFSVSCLNSLAEDIRSHVKEHSFQVAPLGSLSIGLGYSAYFSRCKVDLFLGYDFSYFFSQNLMKTLNDSADTSFFRTEGSLQWQGLCVATKVDF